jgi:hypothetical protein
VDANSGKVIWRHKLGIEQRQSSPIHGDGKIYVAMYISAQGSEKVAEGGGDSGSSSSGASAGMAPTMQ